MTTELQLKRPIDGVTLAIIREIQTAADALGHRAMLVGATARIILVEHVFGLPTGRATRDVDLPSQWKRGNNSKRCDST